MTKNVEFTYKSVKHEGLHVLELQNDNNNTFHFDNIFHLGISRCVINSSDSFKIIHAVKLQIRNHYIEVKSIKNPGMDTNSMK